MNLSLLSTEDEVARVSVSGQIVQRELSPIHDPIHDLLGPNVYSKKLVLDLSQANYIDSSGIGWLLCCHKRFRQHGGQLILQGLQPVVRNVMRVLKLDTVFEFDCQPVSSTAEKGAAR